MTPFREGKNVEDIPAMHAYSSSNATHQCPLTRSRAKKLQEQVNSFLSNCNFHTNENYILPKCCILIVLRYVEEKKDKSDPEERTSASPRRQTSKTDK